MSKESFTIFCHFYSETCDKIFKAVHFLNLSPFLILYTWVTVLFDKKSWRKVKKCTTFQILSTTFYAQFIQTSIPTTIDEEENITDENQNFAMIGKSRHPRKEKGNRYIISFFWFGAFFLFVYGQDWLCLAKTIKTWKSAGMALQLIGKWLHKKLQFSFFATVKYSLIPNLRFLKKRSILF